jgi:positive phototaxis protein PixI
VSNLSPSDFINSRSPLVAENTVTQFLRFQLDPLTKAMLPIDHITEVLKIPFGQIVPIPQMPAWVMGVYNWRGEILWMVDLGHLIGLNSWYQHQGNLLRQTAIVLSPHRQRDRSSNIHLGLIVGRVEDLESCDISTIQAAMSSQANPQLSNFMQGYWLKPEGEMILALDSARIAAAMPISNN